MIAVVISAVFVSCAGKKSFVDNNFKFAELQTENMLKTMDEKISYPRTIDRNGKIRYTHADNWTDGFFPGELWYLYEYSKDVRWKDAAQKWTYGLENLQYLTAHHDIGFLMYTSYGNGYRLTKNPVMRKILIQSANSLITRYDKRVKCIKSWNGRESWDGKTYWYYPVIIDNMMNLELLYFATRETGNPVYAHIATNHALTTMKNHFRADYSTYHVVDYDTITGKPIHFQTCQGFSDNSTWARGQAWAIYGFTMVYRETRDPRFLRTAEKAANFYLNSRSLPKDKVPYWDMNVNQAGYTPLFPWNPDAYKEQPRDASAAAIIASALFELCHYSKLYAAKFRKAAIEMIHSLASDNYRAQAGKNNFFLLMHSTGSLPHKAEIDVPLCYADYYFLEALLRYQGRYDFK